MKWKNASNDGVPKDKDQVLISVDGIYYIAVYHHDNRRFNVYDPPNRYDFDIDQQLIYWTTYTEED